MNSLKLSSKEYFQQTLDSFKKNYGSLFLSPQIEKVTINAGVGNAKFDSKKKQEIYNYVLALTGQKPKKVYSKKSVSNFKLRKGDLVGVMATLRKEKAYNFLLKLIYLALPRSRDFKGFDKSLFDSSLRTYSIGIKSTQIFPTIDFGSSVDFGIQINISFKTATEDNLKLLESINFPFSKTT